MREDRPPIDQPFQNNTSDLCRRPLEYADLLPKSWLDEPAYADPARHPAFTWAILRTLCWHIRHVDDWLIGYHPAAKRAHVRRLRRAARRELERLALAKTADKSYGAVANF